jgi:hypothetical protein
VAEPTLVGVSNCEPVRVEVGRRERAGAGLARGRPSPHACDMVVPDGEVRERGRASANPPELVWHGGPGRPAEEHGGVAAVRTKPVEVAHAVGYRGASSGGERGGRGGCREQQVGERRELDPVHGFH